VFWGSELDEIDTRVIPIERIECSYARNRNPAERPPIPKVGDTVYYRHEEWDREVVRAEVLEVQSFDDLHDENLWRLVRDNFTGQPIIDSDGPRMVRVEDPWPWLVIRPEGHPVTKTWESRVRGSAGWLPLNYKERVIRLPHEVIVRPMPNRNW